jgi:hypothetical protein
MRQAVQGKGIGLPHYIKRRRTFMKKGARRYAALALSAMLAVSGMGNL